MAILQRIGEEQEFLDGIENVFNALLKRQTITALQNQIDSRQDKISDDQIANIEETEKIIQDNLVRRRQILKALTYVISTNLIQCIGQAADDIEVIMSKKGLLLSELLRESPVHLREAKTALSSLEDIVTLFDGSLGGPGSYLPQAVLLYMTEVCSRDIALKEHEKINLIDASFMPQSL